MTSKPVNWAADAVARDNRLSSPVPMPNPPVLCLKIFIFRLTALK
jgi:hypothetical protein